LEFEVSQRPKDPEKDGHYYCAVSHKKDTNP